MQHPLFKEEHNMFRMAVREFVDRELTPHAEEWEEAEAFPPSVFAKLGKLGFLGMCCPEEYGGQNSDFLFMLILAEETTRCGSFGVGMGILTHTVMAMPILLGFGSEEIKRRFLVPAIQGKKISAFAMTEPDAGSDLASIRTKAKRTSDGWILDGQKTFISNGTIADFVLVVARTSAEKGYRGMSTFLVEKGTAGFTTIKLKKLGLHSCDTGELTFDHCLIPAANLIGEEGRGFYQMMFELMGERIIIASTNIARSQVAFDAALKYVQERVQFGQPLSNFQAIRHRFADMATQMEAARQFTYHVAWRYASGEEPVKEASMAKLMGTQVAFKVADEALQFFGGYGYMMDSPIQRYWRDIRLYRIGGGTDEIQREIIARQLFPKVRKE